VYSRITVLSAAAYKNKWVHFAIARQSGVTKVFMNGVVIGSLTDTTNYNGTADLVISNEATVAPNSAFGGYLAYFTWVKGTARYTANFTVTNNYPTLTNDYVLLLKAGSFGGTLGNTVINNNVSIAPVYPPGVSPPNNNNTPPETKMTRSMFSNNSLVFYKPGSLSSCGVGTVRNSSIKSKRI
jgi:hypothetical protein